eukprot:CAMPEP_0117437916 /NCGR_PEP_ID=MMETSP0759-20121206/1778_1 /TAXON_ID=63605 /ORGANISM="Percolomonas cosmopolitus, Strain WS" /LENGTH=687 /DNA_ID=CAMNT_0005229579 /DNA_START=272 /DNA_END=2335 /DNA_ORIENTATION=+
MIHTNHNRSPHVKKYINIAPRKSSNGGGGGGGMHNSPRSANAANNRMRYLDDGNVSPPSPVARTDFSQNPKTIGEIQRSLQYIRQWIRETEPVISSLQTGKDDTPELISMLANRFREKLREELIEKMQKDLLQLEEIVNGRIYKKYDEVKRDLRHLEDSNIREFKEIDEELMHLREQQSKQKQQFLKYQKEQIHEMNQLADATDGVKNLCEEEIRNLHEKLDAKFESTLKVVKDLKELFTKRYDFLSLETTNAINSLTEMTQKNLNVQSLKMDKMYAELRETMHQNQRDALQSHEKLTQRFKAFRQKTNERHDKIFEHHTELKQFFENKLDDLHSVHSQMKKTQNNIIMRIDREASLSLSLQQHQRKQNLHMEERMYLLERSAVIEDLWQTIWSRMGDSVVETSLLGPITQHEQELRKTQEDISQVERQLLERIQASNDQMQQHLEHQQSRQLEEIQESFSKFCDRLEDSVKQTTGSVEDSLHTLSENIDMVQVKNLMDDMVNFIATNHHNSQLDMYLNESTNLLHLMNENQEQHEEDISHLIVHDVVDSMMRNAFDKIQDQQLQRHFISSPAQDETDDARADSRAQVDPKWIQSVSDQLEALRTEAEKARESINALGESVTAKGVPRHQEPAAGSREQNDNEKAPLKEPTPAHGTPSPEEEEQIRQELAELEKEQEEIMKAMMELS